MSSNRFEKHPILTFFVLAVILVVAVELWLRLFTPQMVKFSRDFRKTYRYHDRWYSTYVPNTWTLFSLRNSRGITIYNFILTINKYGFRSYEREIDNNFNDAVNGKKKVIHAIGDSFTQGWGGNYEASYPAQLDFLLPEDYRVINLGMNGFGALGACEKSKILSKPFPPSAVIYLATSNDYMDDDNAYRYSQKPAIIRKGFDLFNWFRHHVYIASVPYAFRWWLFYKGSLSVTDKEFASSKVQHVHNTIDFAFKDTSLQSDSLRGAVSKKALLEYSRYLKEKDIPFIVVAHNATNEVTTDIVAFCRENGIEAHLLQVPIELRYVKDGHFTKYGNYKLAMIMKGILQKHGIAIDTQPSQSSEEL